MEKITPTIVSNISRWIYTATGYTRNNDWEVIGKVVSNVGRTFGKIVVAYNKRDIVKLREEWANLRIHLDGLTVATTINLDEDFVSACASMMSKFDLNEDTATLTKDWAESKGISTRIVHNRTLNIYSNMVEKSVTTDDGTFYPAGMWLVSTSAIKTKLKNDVGLIDSQPDYRIDHIEFENFKLGIVETA